MTFWYLWLAFMALLFHFQKRVDWVSRTRLRWIEHFTEKYTTAVSYNRMMFSLSWSENVDDWQRAR